MTTMNVSLTEEQARFIDNMTDKLGFANRSEFLRALLRRAQTDVRFTKEARTWPFMSPSTKSRARILESLSQAKIYSKEFLDDLKEGLENSDYFSK